MYMWRRDCVRGIIAAGILGAGIFRRDYKRTPQDDSTTGAEKYRNNGNLDPLVQLSMVYLTMYVQTLYMFPFHQGI